MNLYGKQFFLASSRFGRMSFGLLAFAFWSNLAGAAEVSRVGGATLRNRALSFEANFGQYEKGASFVARGPRYYLELSPTDIRIALTKITSAARQSDQPQIIRSEVVQSQYRKLRIELVGANPDASISGQGAVSGLANYFIGNDPQQWRTAVPAYQRVQIKDVYPGIDLVHYGNEQQLEYDFIVGPGMNPAVIAMQFSGVDKLAVDASGELIVSVGDEEIRQPKPVIYQLVHGERKSITGGYVLAGNWTVKFALGDYDSAWPLVIDPIVSYALYLGDTGADIAWAIAVDKAGDIYLAGETMSPSLASSGALQTNLAGTTSLHGDVLLSKVSDYPAQFIYSTYLGGNSEDAAIALALDEAGNAYLTGYTESTNFPTRFGIYTNISGSPLPGYGGRYAHDCFVACINSTGDALRFSTYLGGGALDAGLGIALDAGTNVYVSGYTLSGDFKTRNTTRTNYAGGGDAFVAKLDNAGTNLIYSMFLGGSGLDAGLDLAVDNANSPFVIGYTASSGFPVTTNAIQVLFNNTTNTSAGYDAFLTQITDTVTTDTNSNPLIYSTYLGGTNNDFGFRIVLDASGRAYITGSTFSGDFPRTSTNFTTTVISNAVASDAFITKFNPVTINWDYSATFGGTGKEEGWDVVVDSNERAYVVGASASTDFPTKNPFNGLDGVNAGGTDLFICRVAADGDSFDYAGVYGGSGEDLGYGIALDPVANVYLTGETASTDFSSEGFGGTKDAFVLKIAVEPTLKISAASTNVLLTWPIYAPEFTVQVNTNLLTTNGWQSVAFTPEATNLSYVVTLPKTNAMQFFRLIQQ
jgi:hypothetical protein